MDVALEPSELLHEQPGDSGPQALSSRLHVQGVSEHPEDERAAPAILDPLQTSIAQGQDGQSYGTIPADIMRKFDEVRRERWGSVSDRAVGSDNFVARSANAGPGAAKAGSLLNSHVDPGRKDLVGNFSSSSAHLKSSSHGTQPPAWVIEKAKALQREAMVKRAQATAGETHTEVEKVKAAPHYEVRQESTKATLHESLPPTATSQESSSSSVSSWSSSSKTVAATGAGAKPAPRDRNAQKPEKTGTRQIAKQVAEEEARIKSEAEEVRKEQTQAAAAVEEIRTERARAEAKSKALDEAREEVEAEETKLDAEAHSMDRVRGPATENTASSPVLARAQPAVPSERARAGGGGFKWPQQAHGVMHRATRSQAPVRNARASLPHAHSSTRSEVWGVSALTSLAFDVKVPHGLHGGEPFAFAAHGEEYLAKVPDGYRGGDMLKVEIPDPSDDEDRSDQSTSGSHLQASPPKFVTAADPHAKIPSPVSDTRAVGDTEVQKGTGTPINAVANVVTKAVMQATTSAAAKGIHAVAMTHSAAASSRRIALASSPASVPARTQDLAAVGERMGAQLHLDAAVRAFGAHDDRAAGTEAEVLPALPTLKPLPPEPHTSLDIKRVLQVDTYNHAQTKLVQRMHV